MGRSVPPPPQKFPLRANGGAVQGRTASRLVAGPAGPPQKFPGQASGSAAQRRTALRFAAGPAAPPQRYPAAKPDGPTRGTAQAAMTAGRVAPPPQRYPATTAQRSTIQRMLIAQQPPQSSLPQIGDSLEAEARHARETAKQYAEYLDQYELVWGRYPWQPRPQQRGEYVYQQDPKQRQRDQYEFMRARELLRREAALAGKVQSMGENAQANLQVLTFLYANAQAAADALSSIRDLGEREAFAKKWRERLETQLGRQIIGDQDFARAIRNPQMLVQYFEQGWLQFRQIYGYTDNPRDFLDEVLDHEKGYPRMLNFILQYIPPSRIDLDNGIMAWLNGLSNTSAFTSMPQSKYETRALEIDALWATAGKSERKGFWKGLCGAIANLLRRKGYDYEKEVFTTYVRGHVNGLISALQGLIPTAEILAFVNSRDIEDICDEMGMG